MGRVRIFPISPSPSPLQLTPISHSPTLFTPIHPIHPSYEKKKKHRIQHNWNDNWTVLTRAQKYRPLNQTHPKGIMCPDKKKTKRKKLRIENTGLGGFYRGVPVLMLTQAPASASAFVWAWVAFLHPRPTPNTKPQYVGKGGRFGHTNHNT